MLAASACGDDTGEGGGSEGGATDTTGEGGTDGGSTGQPTTASGTASGGGSTSDGESTSDGGGTASGSGGSTDGTDSGGTAGGSGSTEGSASDGTATTGATTGGTTGGEPTCDAPAACVNPAPADWTGPVRVEDFDRSGATPACPDDFPTSQDELSSGFDAGSAICDCECSPPSTNLCVMPIYYGTDSCPETSGSPDVQVTPNECAEVDEGTGYFAVGDPITSVGECTPSENHMIDTPAFEEGSRVCAGSFDAGGCENGELCVADVGDGILCIVREGEHACPEGPYTEARTLHRDFSDTRSCSECSCGEGSSTCIGDMTFRDGGCTATSLEVINGPGCTAEMTPTHAVFTWDTWTASCPEQGGVPSGTAEATDPVTICCLP